MINPIQFSSSCIKTLTAVEADINRSNQHEFQGVAPLRNIFGQERQSLPASFSIRGSDDIFHSNLTWYDARKANPNRSAEYRLYFESNNVMTVAKAGDTIVIGIDQSGGIHCELIQQGNPAYIQSESWTVQ